MGGMRAYQAKDLIAPFATPPASEDDGNALAKGLGGKDEGDEKSYEVVLDMRTKISEPRLDFTQPLSSTSGPSQKGRRQTLVRPPVFGPEVVVEDPHIIAVHEETVRDILKVGVIWTTIFAAITLSAPARV